MVIDLTDESDPLLRLEYDLGIRCAVCGSVADPGCVYGC